MKTSLRLFLGARSLGAPTRSISTRHLGFSSPNVVTQQGFRSRLQIASACGAKSFKALDIYRQYSIDHTNTEPAGAELGKAHPPFAFAFDIDGVLLHVSKPIPGATETLQYLQKNKIPFILLTNGGGKHEIERVADLSFKLNVELSTDNFVQSHTPFKGLVDRSQSPLGDKTILVTGSDASKCRDIAEQYGFKNVITPADILMAQPTIWPFDPLMEELYAKTARPLPSPQPKISAILVFNDPRDWALDIQIITDLMFSEGGILGTYSAPKFDKRGRCVPVNQPFLFFSNPDLMWAAGYHLPRLGQGAFRASVLAVLDRRMRELGGFLGAKFTHQRIKTIGKPSFATYRYAETVLNLHRAKVLHTSVEELEPLSRVYMVGDNPESDIKGANDFNGKDHTKWTSVLVKTGVYDPERGEPRIAPKMIVDDVAAAVAWALKQEGWR